MTGYYSVLVSKYHKHYRSTLVRAAFRSLLKGGGGGGKIVVSAYQGGKRYMLYTRKMVPYKAVASILKVVRPGSRCGFSRKWVWSCKEVGVIEERR